MGRGPAIVVIDDDDSVNRLVAHWLTREDYQVLTASTGMEGMRVLGRTLPDAVLLDLDLPDASGVELLTQIKARHGSVPVVMMTADSGIESVVSCMQRGAFDYVTKPIDRTKLMTTLRNAVDKGRSELRIRQLERQVDGGGYPGIVGNSKAMQELFRQMDRVAPSDITILIRGESGTGKELVAAGLHKASARRAAPYVAVNCAAIPETLQESELFGHERGSFTGADDRRIGRFEQANGGTLFLDEVGELSMPLQAKLLRALQEQTFYRVGGTKLVRVDVRILAATNRDLRGMVEAGTFREDLYYRLAVFDLLVPPLRDRPGDIRLLAREFANEVSERYGRGTVGFEPVVEQLMDQYPWPGNVRELRNAVERSVVLCEDGTVRLADLPPAVMLGPQDAASTSAPPKPSLAPTDVSIPARRLEDIERAEILRTLAETRGNVSEVVRRLGIPRTTLYRRLRSYGLR